MGGWIRETKRLNPQLAIQEAAEVVTAQINQWVEETRAKVKFYISARLGRLRRDKIEAMMKLGLLPRTAFGVSTEQHETNESQANLLPGSNPEPSDHFLSAP